MPIPDLDDLADLAPLADATAPRRLSVPPALSGVRLDRALATLVPEVSRSRLQQWIEDGAVQLNAAPARNRQAVYAGDVIDVQPRPAPETTAFVPEPMDLAIVHQDRDLIVIDKPPGLVVHPAAGHWSGTLLNGLLAHDPALAALPRAGLVHRLDADTSGLLVVARTLAAQTALVRQLQARSVTREYWAIVRGDPKPRGTIDAAIARDPRNPLRFRTSRAAGAKPARTHYIGVDAHRTDAGWLAWLALRLDTGRTHQIRVHLESIDLPIVGDPVYRGRRPRAPDADPAAPPWLRFPRQALHASRLALLHPAHGAPMQWFAPPPADLAELMEALDFGPLDRPVKVFERQAHDATG